MIFSFLSVPGRNADHRRRNRNARLRPSCEGLESRTVLSHATAVGVAHEAFVRREMSLEKAREAHLFSLERAHAHALSVARDAHVLAFAHAHATRFPLHHARATRLPIHHVVDHGRVLRSRVVTAINASAAPLLSTATTTANPSTSALATVAAPMPTATTGMAAPSSVSTTTATAAPAPADPTLISLDLKPLDVNLLGLQVQTSEIQVTISAQPGSGELLGNLLTSVAGLLNLSGVSNALNNVLGNVVTLANSASLSVGGLGSGGRFGNAPAGTTSVLDLHVAPVNLNLLGAEVKTSNIDLSITAHSGKGLILGNVVTDLADLLDKPPSGDKLSVSYLDQRLSHLLNELNTQLPGLNASPTTGSSTGPNTTTGTGTGSTSILALTVPPINLNLLGLILQTQTIQVNANAQSGPGALLGNLLNDLLGSLDATPSNLATLNNDVNAILGKVVGVLNASHLTISTSALSGLSPALQQLALPNLINPTGTASAPVLNLDIAASTGSSAPPVDVNLLGLAITTSQVNAQLVAQTGQGQILGNLVYNTAHLLDPGGSLNLLSILNELGV